MLLPQVVIKPKVHVDMKFFFLPLTRVLVMSLSFAASGGHVDVSGLWPEAMLRPMICAAMSG